MRKVDAMLTPFIMKRIAQLGLLLMMGGSMSACTETMSWKEEVLLHDGSRIIVKRSLERGGRHEIGQRAGATNETLTFTMPGTNQTVIWEDKLSKDIGSSNFNLLMLEINDGVAYIVASPMGCLSYNKWGRPNPPYVVFKHQDKEWERITVKDLPTQLTIPNLVISSPDDVGDKAVHGVVSAETIIKLNNTASQPQYRTILREPTDRADDGCPELVYYKGVWVGPGDSIGKRMMDRKSK